MKYICAILVGLVLGLASISTAKNEQAKKESIYDLIARNTLCVRVRAEDGQHWCTGSGVILRNRFVLTVGHLLASTQHIEQKIDSKGKPTLVISYDDGQLVREKFLNGNNIGKDITYCKVLHFSLIKNGYDLGLVYSPEILSNDDIKFDESIPKLGQKIITCGSPLCHNAVFSEGIFSRQGVKFVVDEDGSIEEDALDSHSKFFDLASIACAPGNSGGPICNFDTGNVLGVVSHTNAPGSNQFYYVPTRSIRECCNNWDTQFLFGGPIPENLCSKPVVVEPLDPPKVKEKNEGIPLELLPPELREQLKNIFGPPKVDPKNPPKK